MYLRAANVLFHVVAFAALQPGILEAQPTAGRVQESMATLAEERQDPRFDLLRMGVFQCGSWNSWTRSRRTEARTLLEAGTATLPALEAKIREIASEDTGKSRMGAGWLLYTYAAIAKRQAISLINVLRVTEGSFAHEEIDDATAIALGLTSFVTAGQRPRKTFSCERGTGMEPKDVLNLLIEDYFSSKAAPSQPRMVGYRFQDAGRWSLPPISFIDPDPWSEPTSLPPDRLIRLQTHFVNRNGEECGSLLLRFLVTQDSPAGLASFEIDPSVREPLHRVLGYCASPE